MISGLKAVRFLFSHRDLWVSHDCVGLARIGPLCAGFSSAPWVFSFSFNQQGPKTDQRNKWKEVLPLKAVVTPKLLLSAEPCHTAEPKICRVRYIFCLLHCKVTWQRKWRLEKSNQSTTVVSLGYSHLFPSVKYIQLCPKTPQVFLIPTVDTKSWISWLTSVQMQLHKSWRDLEMKKASYLPHMNTT